jgi:hypothetical protein
MIFVVTLLMMSVFVVTPAYADAPVQSEVQIDSYFPVVNGCGFDIVGHDIGTLRTTIWLDENGLPTKAHQNWNIIETWSANGKTLEFKYNFPVHARMEIIDEGYIVYLGAIMITLPGEGVVYAATGLLSYSFTIDEYGNLILTDVLKQVGNWELDWAPICEYLSP